MVLGKFWNRQSRYIPLLPSSPSTYTNSRTPSRRLCHVLIIAVLVILLFAGVVHTFGSHLPIPLNTSVASPSPSPSSSPDFDYNTSTGNDHEAVDVPQQGTSSNPEYTPDFDQDEDLEFLREMVATTKGYFSRDYSLGLGWNNMRYIIEAAATQAQLLNRTLVVPSFVYARSCAYALQVCADQAPMVNKGDAIGWDEWRELPEEQQMAWQIPMGEMLNLTHMRKTHPVILTSDYLRLHNMPVSTETSSGYWDRNLYHAPSNGPGPTLYVAENAWYDPDNVTRVDVLTEDMKTRGAWVSGRDDEPNSGQWPDAEKTSLQETLDVVLNDRHALPWDEARSLVQVSSDDDAAVEDVLTNNGWEVVYSFQGAGGMDFVKHVASPVKEAVPRHYLRGWADDYAMIDTEVLVLAGETHLYRPPGQMRFTTTQSQENFARAVLHEIVALDKVYDLARKLDFRISEMNDGRAWVASHMRRGDFVTAGWAWGDTHVAQLKQVKEKLEDGVTYIESHPTVEPYDIPDMTPDPAVQHRKPPQHGDKFYVATDEQKPDILAYFSDNGAIMISDLLTIEDRREFGWPILFNDILGLVEQATLARASYFYGAAMSSFSGGVINRRAVLGADRNTGICE
ncbi:hypothetical protein CONPUDRAFT_78988 [Coniophora puteana RWD-64-598 SS2]|uniref:Uncharacterized protein n=1 Tax=Coniophora puteana (strain RWD-64-598) TaxID=741705 RepID=A0A5M3N5R0_CONPW|nr:uncharacterized protein CONPUDRAFT_78988 [Coniophora puteana RWD-64-598 SS2]EIW86739.1 hypothetical protein CONPUDRAFT_78988 [Coniophora puteana RWD-64-598 SS2]